MFSYDDSTEETKPADYTGLKILAIVLPVFLVFIFLGDADMSLTVTIVLGLIIFAIKLRWNLRRHVWFGQLSFLYWRSTSHCFSSFTGPIRMFPRLLTVCRSESQIS